MNIKITGKLYVPLSEDEKKEIVKSLKTFGIFGVEFDFFRDNDTTHISNIPIDKQFTHYLVNSTTTAEFDYMQKQMQRENNNVSISKH